jgi:hypothetical protein
LNPNSVYVDSAFHVHGLTSKNAEEYAGGKADDILAYCHGSELDNNVTLKLM